MPRGIMLVLTNAADGRDEELNRWILRSRAEREEALAAGRDPVIPISDALAEERVSFLYEPVGERVAAPAKVV